MTWSSKRLARPRRRSRSRNGQGRAPTAARGRSSSQADLPNRGAAPGRGSRKGGALAGARPLASGREGRTARWQGHVSTCARQRKRSQRSPVSPSASPARALRVHACRCCYKYVHAVAGTDWRAHVCMQASMITSLLFFCAAITSLLITLHTNPMDPC